MNRLTDRQESILGHVVETYIDTAHPVGSKCVLERYRIGYSSATIRNEMGLLEDGGFLKQPHISSGRIPTDLGYRYYVNYGLTGYTFPEGYFNAVEGRLKAFSEEIMEGSLFAEEASRLLSTLSHEASIVVITGEMGGSFPERKSFKLSLQGSRHILAKPEFRDIDKVRELFEVLEDRHALTDCLMNDEEDDAVHIKIGRENEPEAFHECAIISTRYRDQDGPAGALALIGPMRMSYARTVPLIERIAGMVGTLFEERAGH